MAIPPVVLLLKRRKIGTIVLAAGAVLVAVGFLLPLTAVSGTAAGAGTTLSVPNLPGGFTVSLPAGSSTGVALPTSGSKTVFDLVRHVFDHSLLSTGIGSSLVDVATRGGAVLMAAALLLAVGCSALPLLRGFAGIAAGLGLFGSALVIGVITGEHMRSVSLCAGGACTVDLHAGIWVCAVGFVVILVGGAVAAIRPLAGLFGGISFAVTGAVLGAGVAYLIAAQHVLDVVTNGLPAGIPGIG